MGQLLELEFRFHQTRISFERIGNPCSSRSSALYSRNKQRTEDTRRIRIDNASAEGLQPGQALRLYVQGKDFTDARQEKLINYGDALINLNRPNPYIS
ncbi:MAG: hypothetical protein CM1200mP35_07730 [Chloroflexota bacterium]|nr:MAG: hypothetical protein CM1200mP35_07730 [Chloroflexota bacterium]